MLDQKQEQNLEVLRFIREVSLSYIQGQSLLFTNGYTKRGSFLSSLSLPSPTPLIFLFPRENRSHQKNTSIPSTYLYLCQYVLPCLLLPRTCCLSCIQGQTLLKTLHPHTQGNDPSLSYVISFFPLYFLILTSIQTCNLFCFLIS